MPGSLFGSFPVLGGIFPAGAVRNELGEEFRGRNQERCSDQLCKTMDHRATPSRPHAKVPARRMAGHPGRVTPSASLMELLFFR